VLVQAVSSGDSFVRRKEARHWSCHRRQRARLHGRVPSRSHSIVFAVLPARVSIAGRARTKAAVLLLACVFDDRNEGASSGDASMGMPLRAYLYGQFGLSSRRGRTTTKRASTHLLGPTSKEGDRGPLAFALQVCLRG